ncbi:hypothetical protein [Rhodohalobacter mucosus]|uniref:Uncharacterized protein n=1 Tax=Rhodohalobacter mucosus TaxID=2079485 RepID=A0A316TT98_9BACT|nr:hypothetical protein [Rhodohalobacter mucosus]PWN07640.1 hypothetical protein DDZ15_03790 [Rhodohalobacter mucosus]
MNKTNKKSVKTLAIWTIAWVLSTALAAFGPVFVWESQTVLTGGAIGINFLVGIGMIFANIHHITSLDEMLQKIQLQAMGITLGATLVAGISYSLMDTTNLMAADAEISFLVIFMGLTYMAAVVIGYRRYK